jgi:ABC-type dipeptide/oligopeptide/nickel transport system ATPase component
VKPILDILDLRRRFSVGKHQLHAVDNVSFQIMPGEAVGLVGESGCGKSTLVRMLTRVLDVTEGSMDINIPEIVAEVTEAFSRYELALVTNDLPTLDSLFWDSPLVLRFGAGENLYGIDAIRAFRAVRSTSDLARDLRHTLITTFGQDYATANTEFSRRNSGTAGRQSQTWVRLAEGWRIVAAHVSIEKN